MSGYVQARMAYIAKEWPDLTPDQLRGRAQEDLAFDVRDNLVWELHDCRMFERMKKAVGLAESGVGYLVEAALDGKPEKDAEVHPPERVEYVAALAALDILIAAVNECRRSIAESMTELEKIEWWGRAEVEG